MSGQASQRQTADRQSVEQGGRRRSGFVVLIVLIVIVMLTYSGLAFVLNLSTENRAAHLRGEELQREMVLASGEELVRSVAAAPAADRQTLGGFGDNALTFQGIAVQPAGTEASVGEFSVVSPRVEGETIAGFRFGLENESAKLNLGVLMTWEAAFPGAARDALLNLPGMTEPIADALLDWMDGDPTPREAGAEAELYASRGAPYGPRNGIPVALEELLLIRDLDRGRLFGGDIDRNFTVEAWEQQPAAGGASAPAGQLPWSALITLYSGERNEDAEGQPRVFLNDDDLESLHAALSEEFSPELADFVAAYRIYGPAANVPEGEPANVSSSRVSRGDGRRISREPGRSRGSQGEISLDLSQPASFPIDSLYELVDTAVELPADQLPSRSRRPSRRRRGSPSAAGSSMDEPPEAPPPVVLTSPLASGTPRFRDLLPQLLDRTTAREDAVVRGRINVYEAPRAVLLSVPELEPQILERILAVRDGYAGGGDLSHLHLTWLLEEQILDSSQMQIAERYLTGGGDVFRGQVVARLAGSPRVARAEFVVDATVKPPRRVYWKDLGLLGGGFDPSVFGAAAP